MKAIDQFLMVALVAAFLPSSLKSQSPCMFISGESPMECSLITEANPYSHTGNQVTFHLGDPIFDLNPPPPLDHSLYVSTTPRYKAFWILGDGNFLYSPNNEWYHDLQTHTQPYTYNLAARYTSRAVLVEKKSNTSPPREPGRVIDITSTPITPGTPLNPRITGNNSMDIFNHERNRPDYPTVFVLSSRKSNPGIDSFYFFFNCSHELQSNTYTRMEIHDSVKFMECPNYFSLNGYTPPVRSIMTLPAYFSPIAGFLTQRFQSFISIPISQFLDQTKNPFQETRVFPALNTIFNPTWQDADTGAITLPWGHYLVIATGQEPLSLKRAEEIETVTQAHGYFTDASGILLDSSLQLNNAQGGAIRYIRGISNADVQVVAAIDPNGLTIQEICPIGTNRYEVKIRMEVCNEGYMDQPLITFTLNDPSALFSKPEFGTVPDFNYTGFTPTGAEQMWGYSWMASLPGVHPPGSTDPPVNTCKELIFTTTTNWLGVQKLIRSEGLELCVKFSYGRPLCHYNTPVEASEVTPTTGYKCANPSSASYAGQCCCLSFYSIALGIIIIVLLLWIIWLLYKRKFTH